MCRLYIYINIIGTTAYLQHIIFNILIINYYLYLAEDYCHFDLVNTVIQTKST